MVTTPARLVVPILLLAPLAALTAGERVLDPRFHHLGDTTVKDWTDATPEPEGTAYELDFDARANAGPAVLWLTYRHSNEAWSVRLNGAEIGRLEVGLERRTRPIELAPGALADGANRLEVVNENVGDDIVIGDVRLDDRPLDEILGLGHLRLTVRDGQTGAALAARLTILDAGGQRAPLFRAAGPGRAVRDGILYTARGAADASLPRGRYTIVATRGMEWGLARLEVGVEKGGSHAVELELRREVETPDLIACDTHVHTFPTSDHGDALLEERMVTIAGEGLDLVVATDHNHNTDYAPHRDALALEDAFVAVTGNEVTTKIGHFNAFPLDPGDAIPDPKLRSWPELVEAMRGKGAQVVILNHPRWPDVAKGPFGEYGLDRATGSFADGRAFPFDATEVLNSGCPLDDPLYLVHDWLALLAGGTRVLAVGSSDSHTVFDNVGQGRTYVRSSADTPAEIDVDQFCATIRAGDMRVAYGIFVDLTVNGAGVGGTADVSRAKTLDVAVRVAAPSWIRPRRLCLFRGDRGETPVLERQLEPTNDRATDRTLRLRVPAPPRDSFLVAVVVGDGVPEAWFRTLKDYTLGLTNPVWLDADGDGRHRWQLPAGE